MELLLDHFPCKVIDDFLCQPPRPSALSSRCGFYTVRSGDARIEWLNESPGVCFVTGYWFIWWAIETIAFLGQWTSRRWDVDAECTSRAIRYDGSADFGLEQTNGQGKLVDQEFSERYQVY
jgi:hypothetical protein